MKRIFAIEISCKGKGVFKFHDTNDVINFREIIINFIKNSE